MSKTSTPKSFVAPDLDTIVSEIDIAAPPERVFRALIDPEEVRKRAPLLDVYEMDARVGGRWRLELRAPKPRPDFGVIRHHGEILDLDPPRLLVYTWFANFHNDPKSRSIVRSELSAIPVGTHVTVTHSGLASEPSAAKDYAGGWPGVLGELRTYLENTNHA